MYLVVFATHNAGVEKERAGLESAFTAYLRDAAGHPDVTLHHGGQTLDESGDTATGLLLVLEAPSLDAAQAFVAGSPYAKAGIIAETQIRPWNWLTGRPG